MSLRKEYIPYRKFSNTIAVSVSERPEPSPLTFTVDRNAITFHITEPTYVGMNIYDPSGRLVRRITYGFVGVGTHKVGLGRLPKGVYTSKVRIGRRVENVKLVR